MSVILSCLLLQISAIERKGAEWNRSVPNELVTLVKPKEHSRLVIATLSGLAGLRRYRGSRAVTALTKGCVRRMSGINWKSVFAGVVVGAVLVAAAPVVAGEGDPVRQGKGNVVNKRTTLKGKSLATLRLINERGEGTALVLNVEPGNPPLRVNSRKKVEDLNADLLDGRTSDFFQTQKAQPGDTLVGAFGASGDGTFLMHAATFNPPLITGVPQSKIHYVLPDAGTTNECPGVFQAATGHLCIYATWERNVAYNGIGRINNDLINSGASRYGFVLLWTGTSSSANVRGNWAFTVPASADIEDNPVSDYVETEAGLAPAPAP